MGKGDWTHIDVGDWFLWEPIWVHVEKVHNRSDLFTKGANRKVLEQRKWIAYGLHWLEKVYDLVLRDILWKALEKKGVCVAYIKVIQDMYLFNL